MTNFIVIIKNSDNLWVPLGPSQEEAMGALASQAEQADHALKAEMVRKRKTDAVYE